MIGQIISHYKIIEQLGAGGMGLVYKAEDIKLRRQVALKFLPPELSYDPDAKERFVHEAQAASALDHPNICTVHEIGETQDGSLFIAMACYDGETLKDRIRRGPLNVNDALSIAAQVAHGLARAHEAGIVHRDIKPANIMVTSHGEVKILDFGVAKLAGLTKLTRTGSTVGTAAYMSPEQARGEDVDHRTDIWSLGVVLYEMIAGRAPFKSDYEQALVYEILNEDAKPLSDFSADLPDGLQAIVEKALAKDTANRYQHIEEMHADLEAVSAGRPVNARIARQPPSRLRSRVLWYTVLVAALLLVAETVYRLVVTSVQHGPENLTVAILPFEDQTHDSAVALWVPTLQRVLSSELSTMKKVGIFDPASLNGLLEHELGTAHPPRGPRLDEAMKDAKITHVVDGVVIKTSQDYELNSNVIDLSKGEIRYSVHVGAGNPEALQKKVDSVSHQLQGYFEMVLHLNAAPELTPWIEHQTSNVEALIAFEKAYEMQYNAKGGWDPYLRRAIELDSTFVTPRLWLIEGLAGRGEVEEARQHYRTLRRLESGASPFEQAMINWAGAYLDDDLAAQERYLKIALEFAPGNYILLNSLGATLSSMGKYQEAVEALKPLVEKRWNYSFAFLALGECYCRLNQYDLARDILEQSLSVRPVYPEIYGLLFTLMLRQRDSAKAAKYEGLYFQRTHEVGYSLDASYTALASRCAVEGYNDYAAKYFLAAIALRPDIPQPHNGLGEAFYDLGDTSAARKELLRALELDSSLFKAHIMLGKMSESQGKNNDALNHYRQYLRFDSTSNEAVEIRKSAVKLNH